MRDAMLLEFVRHAYGAMSPDELVAFFAKSVVDQDADLKAFHTDQVARMKASEARLSAKIADADAFVKS